MAHNNLITVWGPLCWLTVFKSCFNLWRNGFCFH